ncbi:P-loop containing nucleoside triphosphate hydrolase protein [Mucor mucedo]|uniref:P-loop containing nucleoside triphosphate hydrolase protein n=1 Tax=Mucor mucedo TaxID=29922 RepID=UPI00221F9DC5|nr:P-loop containing nucleoside triphosphate hydrolase protein [Mucor mucedo]KAI7891280.1 P-loop containing nucleoside triphosphate hydrolase protein [Mucor mucedo]
MFLFNVNLHLIHQTIKPLVRYRLSSTAIPYAKLRPYQKECIATTVTEIERGCRKQIVSLPVGNVIMSNLIPRIPCPTSKATKVLLLAHRTELLDQAHNQITRYNPNLIVHVEQGKRKVDIDKADVIIASVPTLGRANSAKIENYDPSLFKAILIDEAHHAVASTYMNILTHFGVYEPDSKMLVWGCSATVRRHDGLGLSDVFDKITYHVDFMKMIEQGYLSSMKVTTVNTHVDLENVGISKNDFKQSELSRAVNTDTRNEVIVSSWKKYAHEQGRKSTLVFAVDIDHTVKLCNYFLKSGISASFITSQTPALTRHQILQDFKDGKIPVLVNCAILTEGTDIPCVDCILLGRPTRSNTLFQQMFGRGLRLFPGKEDCLLIDFVDNFKRSGSAGLVTIPTLLGLSTREMINDQDILALEARAVKEQQDGEKEIQEEQERTENDPSLVKLRITQYDTLNELMADLSGSNELRNASHNGWIDIGTEKCALHVMKKGYVVLERKGDIWTGSFRYENNNYRAKPFSIPLESDDMTSAVRAADTWVQKKYGNILRQTARNAGFRKHNISEAQKRALSRYKIETADTMTKGQAMDLLVKLKFGQLKIWKDQVKFDKARRKEEGKKSNAAVLVRNRHMSSVAV